MNMPNINAIITFTSGVMQKLFIANKHNDFKPIILRGNFLLYVVCAVLVVKIIILGLYFPASYNIFFADITKMDLVNLLNENRQNLGLGTLTESEALNQAAYLKAQDMVKYGYFSHESPQGITPWFWFKKAGYTYKYAGENLAVGFADSETVYNAWFNSSSHKENLLNKHYTEIGTAIVTGFQGNAIVVVQLFGSPLKTLASAPETPVKPALPITSKPTQPIAETPKPTAQAPAEIQVPAPQDSDSAPRVLAETTEYIVSAENIKTNRGYWQWIGLVVSYASDMLWYVSCFIALVIATCLMINTLFGYRAIEKSLLFKSLALIAILTVVIFIDKNITSHIIPHQIII